MSSWLFGAKTPVNDPPAPATALRIQSSIQGRARAKLWGTQRLAGNLIWEGDFAAHPHTTSVGSNNWFQHIFSKAQTVDLPPTYTASVAIALADGPVEQVLAAWNGTTKTTAASLGFTTFNGYFSQTAWSYLVSAHPDAAFTYRGTSYLAEANFDLGESPSLPNFNFEVRSSVSGYGPDGLDANAADVLMDLHANPANGVNFPFYRFDQVLADYFAYSQASGMVVSPVLAEQGPASSFIASLTADTNSSPRWSNGILSIVPWGDQNITANGATYTANVTPVYDLGDDDWLPNQGSGNSGATSDEPVIVTLKDPALMINSIPYEYLQRTNSYDPVAAVAKDEAAITAYGEHPSSSKQLHDFALADAAQQSATLSLIREQIQRAFIFTLPPHFILVDVEDLVTLTRPKLHLDHYPVRVKDIVENSDGSLTFTCEDFLGTSAVPFFGTQASNGLRLDFNSDPGGIADAFIFEPPQALANNATGTTAIFAAVCGMNPSLFGGANVWFSTDGVTYNAIGTMAPCTMGHLTASLASHANPDTVNTLSVDLTESARTLNPGNATDRAAGIPPCAIDDEILAYENTNLTSAFHYDLTTLNRGAFGSTPAAHASGANFVLVNDAVFKMTVANSMAGSTVYFKFQAFNIFNGGLQDLSTIDPIPHLVGSGSSSLHSGTFAGVASFHSP